MQVATRADRGQSRDMRMIPAFVAAAALAVGFAAGSASAAPQQLAQRMSPAQSMTQPSGNVQAERIAPMSGTSRAGLVDQMGQTGGGQRAAAAAGRSGASYTPASSRREARETTTTSSRAGRSQDVNAISEYNRTEGALLVNQASGIREIAQLRGSRICFPNPADQAEAAKFLGGRAVSFTAVTADGPPTYLVESFNRGDCQAIYMSRQTQQMMANMSIPGAVVLTR